jgi:hypothetical protein
MATDYTADANCMGAWLMTSNGGNETDVSGEGETLTQDSGTIPTSTDVPTGYGGTSRDFDKADTEWLYHVDGGSTDISGSNQDISLVIWAKPITLGTGEEPTMMSKFGDTSNNQYIFFLVDRGDGWLAELYLDSSGNFTTVGEGTSEPDSVSTGSWIHIAGVYNDTDIRMYINASLSGTPVSYSSGIYNGNSQFRVGIRQFLDSHPFDGLLTESAIFNRELSSTEILELYTYGLQGTYGTTPSGFMTTNRGFWK